MERTCKGPSAAYLREMHAQQSIYDGLEPEWRALAQEYGLKATLHVKKFCSIEDAQALLGQRPPIVRRFVRRRV